MPEPNSPPSLAVIILAAGKGTRMKNPDIAKVMFPINGKPMVEYVVELVAALSPARTLLVVGWQKESVVEYISGKYPSAEFVEQREQLGTGHAVLQAAEALKDFSGDVLLLSGDVPLLAEKTARALVGYHRMNEGTATILTAEVGDATGYGRIVRNDDGGIEKIVEQKDASKKELAIHEINSGIYVFNRKELFEALGQLTPDNAQGEYYLTDVFGYFWKKKLKVVAVKVIDPVEVTGINDFAQLESARARIADRTAG